MARNIKLPDELKGWKIISLISEKKGHNIYRISNKTSDGEKFANLYHIFAYGNDYTNDKARFYADEAAFLNSIAKNQEYFTCLGAFFTDNKAKSKIDLYIATEDLTPLSKTISHKEMSDLEVAQFGLRMADILAFLELKSVFHGDIRPENIYVTDKGDYKLGGFSDFENKISDLSYAAPEVAKDEVPDFTTDIYSLGLVMYYLSNDKKLPFENEEITKNEAIEKRISGKSISAPANGNEKLKSVIVIACQAENKNRWKNANNMRNALQVIVEEIAGTKSESPTETITVIPSAQPESFESNVFDEVVYEDTSMQQPESVTEDTQQEITTEISEQTDNNKTVEQLPDNFDDNNSFTEIYAETDTQKEVITDNKIPVITEPISEDVFETYEAKGEQPVKDENPIQKQEIVKDYGSFFDDENEDKTKENNLNDKSDKTESKVDKDNNNNPQVITLENNDEYETIDENDTHKSSKLSKVLIALSVIVIIAALFFVGFIVYNKAMTPEIPINPSTNDEATQTTTQAITTEPVTTQEPTTKPETVEVPEVVGFGYSYAKEVLEEYGFVVEEGNYNYSSIYDEGYVTEQSLEPYTSQEKGSTIVLDISLGEEMIETTKEPENNDFMFESSNATYLSKSDLESLSEYELEIALNEIYARRGRIFNDQGLSEYFNSQKWYTPTYSPDEFNSNVTLNDYEEANIKLIVDIQKEKGYR